MNDDNEYTQLDHQEWINATDEYDPSFDEPEYTAAAKDRGEGENHGLPARLPGRSQSVAPSNL